MEGKLRQVLVRTDSKYPHSEDSDAAKSDEAFLEQTELKAREALGRALFGGGEAAHSDSDCGF